MARVEGFTYAGHVVGTSAPTSATEILSARFCWDNVAGDDEESDTFCSEFIVKGTSRADLESKCATVRAALRTKNQALSVDWGSQNVVSYSPLVAAPTGWDARPTLRKLRRRTTDVGYVRGFEFRVSVRIPSNYTDPNLTGSPAANGRRTSEVELSWDTNNRRMARISGKFHLIATKLPRAQTTTAQLNNPTGTIDTYCVARLAKVDPAAEWTIGRRSERDNNTQTEMTFSRDYYETIHGRFAATPEVSYRGSRLRTIVIRGTFFRTYSASYDGTATRSASTNYSDATYGGSAYGTTQLAALGAALGGNLTVGTDCELVSERATPNDQDDRLDYELTYRELNFKQSNASSPGLDDAEIVNDQIRFVIKHTPLDDSPVPAAGGAGGPNPFAGVPALDGGAGGKPAGTGAPGTLDKSVVPPGGGNPGEAERSPGVQVRKPVMIIIEYNAELKKTVADPRTKWYSDIRPWLVGQWAAELGFGPTYLMGEEWDEEVQGNFIHAYVAAIALPGDLIAYNVEDAVDDEVGEALDQAMTGTAYEYLRQQELPERRKYRRHTATFKTGSSFDPSSLLTQSSVPGYVVARRSKPRDNTRIVGIPNLGIPTQDLRTITFVEEMMYVARDVGTGAAGLPSGAASSGGGSQQTGNPTLDKSVTTPTNPGGQ